MDLFRLFFGVILLGAVAAGLVWAIQDVTQSSCVGVLRVDGTLTTGDSFGGTSTRSLAEAIAEWDSSSSKALLVEVNSPGGSAVGSAEVFEALRETKKPTVAYMGEVAASGGYYVAAGTSYIVANPSTITGSIGAVTDLLNYEQLLEKIGIQQDAVKSGELKDMGAGYRNLTAEEKALLQELVDDSAASFRKDVEAARGAKLTAYYNQTRDARILTARRALGAGLVDQIGTRKEALKKAAQLGGLDPEGVQECPIQTRQAGLQDFFQGAGSAFAKGMAATLSAQQMKVS